MLVKMRYVQTVRSRGKTYTFYRRGGVRAPIRGEIGSDEWRAEYERLHAAAEAKGEIAPAERDAKPGTLAALWLAYQASREWRQLAPRTQASYRYLIEPMLPVYGRGRIESITPEWVQTHLDTMAETPSKAKSWLAVFRLLLSWSIPRGWLAANPAQHIKPPRHRAQSHRPWTDAEIDAMTAPGLPTRLPVLIGLYTAQRLGDVLRLPWSAYEGGSIAVRQSKTGAELSIPAHPALIGALSAERRAAVVICTRPDGGAWKIDHFKHVFTATRRSLGLAEDLHFHGLRHSAASRLAEAGCSHAEIAAITGHKSLSMVSHYSAGAKQRTLARAAIARLPTTDRERKV